MAVAAAPPGLHLAATPIGNLGDITLRALETLAGSDVIYCEDTRVTRKLLDRYGITAPLSPYHEHNAAAVRPKILARLAQGDYVSGTLDMRSGVKLDIAGGARLLGSLNLADWPERIAKRRTVQDTNMGMNQSLIFAEGLRDIAIGGDGTIDGRGGRFHGDETIHGTPGRPFLLRVIDCRNVHISGLFMKDSPCWMQNYLNCDNLLIEGLRVENQCNWNNDGMDIDGCRNVIVRGCHISSGDDGICFKGAAQAPAENILIENCTVFTSCNALKLGTDSQSGFRNVLARNLILAGVDDTMRHVKPVDASTGISCRDMSRPPRQFARSGRMASAWRLR